MNSVVLLLALTFTHIAQASDLKCKEVANILLSEKALGTFDEPYDSDSRQLGSDPEDKVVARFFRKPSSSCKMSKKDLKSSNNSEYNLFEQTYKNPKSRGELIDFIIDYFPHSDENYPMRPNRAMLNDKDRNELLDSVIPPSGLGRFCNAKSARMRQDEQTHPTDIASCEAKDIFCCGWTYSKEALARKANEKIYLCSNKRCPSYSPQQLAQLHGNEDAAREEARRLISKNFSDRELKDILWDYICSTELYPSEYGDYPLQSLAPSFAAELEKSSRTEVPKMDKRSFGKVDPIVAVSDKERITLIYDSSGGMKSVYLLNKDCKISGAYSLKSLIPKPIDCQDRSASVFCKPENRKHFVTRNTPSKKAAPNGGAEQPGVHSE